MITYVVNTSENKTFDSDQLFKLSGYKKINWLNVGLNEVDKCIDIIKTRQGAIESEEFRIAVLVDFYHFDRIRSPYGKENYANDLGVECSLYLPYIEGYLRDKFFEKLEKKELHSADYEVFYIKGGKLEMIDNLDNLKDQIGQIVEPIEESYVETHKKYIKDVKTVYEGPDKKVYTEEERASLDKQLDELNKRLYEDLSDKQKKEILGQIQDLIDYIDQLEQKTVEYKHIVEERAYREFKLYCSPTMSLKFDIDEFPYSINVSRDRGLSTNEFFEAFCERARKSKKIRRYIYNTSLGGSPAKAAFENLALSLNLIRLYEREDALKEEGLVEIDAIEPEKLRDLLLSAWNKIVQAKKVSKENTSLYFSLKEICENDIYRKEHEQKSPTEQFEEARAGLIVPDDDVKNSIDKQYEFIMSVGKKGEKIFVDQDKKEFDEILSTYLRKRNDTTERDVEEEFKDKIKTGRFQTTSQCPPQQEFDFVVGQKQDEISRLMSDVLKAEYSVQKFEDEKKYAQQYYEQYLSAKKVLQRGTIGDIIFLVLTLLTVILPYVISRYILGINLGTVIIFAVCCVAFFALFILSFAIAVLPAIRKMNRMKHLVKECYKDCLAKKKVALEDLKRRYEVDLINIEYCRYEIRQLTYLFELNVKKDRNINVHRHVLDELENNLGTILNNLGIHPVIDDSVSVDREFNMFKSILSYENKIYRVFSLDAIESLLSTDKSKKNKEVI